MTAVVTALPFIAHPGQLAAVTDSEVRDKTLKCAHFTDEGKYATPTSPGQLENSCSTSAWDIRQFQSPALCISHGISLNAILSMPRTPVARSHLELQKTMNGTMWRCASSSKLANVVLAINASFPIMTSPTASSLLLTQPRWERKKICPSAGLPLCVKKRKLSTGNTGTRFLCPRAQCARRKITMKRARFPPIQSQ